MRNSNNIVPNSTTLLPTGGVRRTTSDNGGRLPVLVIEDAPVGSESDYETKRPRTAPNVKVGTDGIAGRKDKQDER